MEKSPHTNIKNCEFTTVVNIQNNKSTLYFTTQNNTAAFMTLITSSNCDREHLMQFRCNLDPRLYLLCTAIALT